MHSSLSIFHLIMLSYLYNYKYLKEQMKRVKKYGPVSKKKDLNFKIPANSEISFLIKRFSDKYKKWLKRILNENPHKLIKRRI